MSKRNHLTVADYAVVALCPSLIVLLLASLVYFVILCAYHGEYSSRLGYVWFMFILGAVGIARISIEQSRGYATGYAAVLGLATFVVLSRFQVLGGPAAALSPLVNALLIAAVWVLADRITFDCTLVDDDKDASGQGLLDGLSSRDADAADEANSSQAVGGNARRRRGHQPGRTVLWLTAAALPMFGIGQVLLRSDPRLQAAAMFALAIYLFAALSLLVATSFLGVRRYLRQRGVDMPSNVSTAWLGGGVIMTALILLLCFALPQPGRMLANLELPAVLQSTDWLSPSRHGWGSEAADPADDAESSNAAVPGDDPQEGNQGDNGTQSGPSSKPDAEAQQSGAESDDDQSGGDQSGGKQSGGKQSGGKQSGGDQSGGKQSGGQTPSNPGSNPSAGEQQKNDSAEADSPQQGEGQTDKQAAEDSQAEEDSQAAEDSQSEEANSEVERGEPPADPSGDTAPSDSQSSSPPPPSAAQPPAAPSPLSQLLPSLGWLVKAIIYLVLLAIIAAFLWIHRSVLADFWQRLMAWFTGRSPAAATNATEQSIPLAEPIPPRPFASFSNPLVSGADPRRAVIETFQATEAWYREHGQPRKIDETPQEYCLRLKTIDVNERRAVGRLTEAYNRIVYGGGGAGPRDLETVKEVWQSFSGV